MPQRQRHTVANVLGYTIQRIEMRNEAGAAISRYQVTAPGSGALLGSFADRAQAERHIIGLELSSLYRPPPVGAPPPVPEHRQRNPARLSSPSIASRTRSNSTAR